MIFGSIQNTDALGLFGFKVGFPDHSQRVASSSSKVITIFREGRGIGTSVVSIKSILETAFVDFPYFDFGVKRGGDHIVIFGMEVNFGDRLPMSIIILN